MASSEEPSNQKTEMLPPRPKDDPTPAIRDILEIVDTLHQKFVPPSQKDEVLTKSRSMVANLTNPSQAPDQNVSLRTTTSLPVTSSTEQDDTERYIPKLRRNLRLLKEDVVKLQDLRCEVADEVGKHITPLEKLLKKVEKDSSKSVLTKGMKKDLEDINKKIFNLMCQVPLLPNKRRKPGGLDDEGGDGENNGKGIECLPGIHANEEYLKRLAVYRDVESKFKNLSVDRKICLLSFAVFPENQEVNRTMLMYWWMGEGILVDEGRPEDVVKAILDEFVAARLIEPVENKRKVKPNSYKMTPFVHSSLILISKEIKLFDIYRKGEKPTMHKSDLNKVCLVEGSSSQKEAKATRMPDVNRIETVFNVSERFPDFAFKWFSEDQPKAKKKFGPMSKPVFKLLKVFYLGRWERTATRHIEVENPELMRHLKHMTKLRLLSFQGISRIERLDDAVCKLRELIILDLRACYNLEKLPEKIDSLKSLTYLDITDCYMIDRMPKRLSWLNNLVVLKGFVVSDANDEEKVCTLAELVHLEKLRKLSITINKGDFSVNDLFLAVEEFKSLEKFKVAWGGINEHKKVETTGGIVKEFLRTMTIIPKGQEGKLPKVSKQIQLPKMLKKLDLQCFPDPVLPLWLKPHKLGGLEKLYIKGGTELTGFGELVSAETNECKVTVLRLKFLPRFKVEWRELRELFPNLEFLDKYQSPQVSFCPCDGIGIWRKKPEV
ncbi:unnamed protein product [Eruca vesicaria subsp. sativa]|uniref:Disease resistance RPP13-like protein 4 n=1 Tax=Eruca vesicaria subsp. sativa TaxID=29727 RepID=A0ABC8M1D4_ERUVS|nr:unnamed protein product [Eruca vesicaria subsp. sativa]